MDNLTITKSEEEEIEKAEDSLNIKGDIKHLLDNVFYQNKEIRGDTYFIYEKDAISLPEQICKIVDSSIRKN